MNKAQLIQSLREKGFPQKIINAFSNVKREEFVSKQFFEQAY